MYEALQRETFSTVQPCACPWRFAMPALIILKCRRRRYSDGEKQLTESSDCSEVFVSLGKAERIHKMIFLLCSLLLAFPLCTILAVCSCCCPPDSPLFFSFSLCPPQVCFLGEVHGSTVPRGKTPHQQVKNHPLVWHPLWPPPVAQ